MMQGMLLAPLAAILPERRPCLAHALLLVWRGAGMIAGVLGAI
jgi:hypothetical protein